jgi:23S rRNA pseudouridine2457 synthase
VTAGKRTIVFNKPYDMVSQFTPKAGHPCLKDSIDLPGIYPVGRLDADSEGLLLLTEDGGLAHRLLEPRFAHPRTYWAQVERVPDEPALAKLRSGVVIEGKLTKPAKARLLAEEPALPPRPVPIRYRKNIPTAWIELVLTEGRNRQVRKMTAAVGHPTLRLVRVAIGAIELGALRPGAWRDLDAKERQGLLALLRS